MNTLDEKKGPRCLTDVVFTLITLQLTRFFKSVLLNVACQEQFLLNRARHLGEEACLMHGPSRPLSAASTLMAKCVVTFYASNGFCFHI